MQPVNVWDYERLAEEKLDVNAHAYFAGGAGDEVTLRANESAFGQLALVPRVLRGEEKVRTDVTLFGGRASMGR